MSWMLMHASEYRMMRKRARVKAREQNSKAAFEQRMQALIRAVDE
jgi:hypothetical protein